ncbi:MAG: hypothetical protein Q9175_001036 [Cornicularia normoerica]
MIDILPPPFLIANSTFYQQYFSSLERLRLAQNSASPTKAASVKSCHGTVKASTPKPSSSRPTLARSNSSYFKNPHILRRKTPSPTSDTILPSDAQWFLKLPDKVQRKHFTREERLALSGHRDSIVPDDSDEKFYKFYKQGKEGNRSVPTLRTSSYSSLSSLNTLDDEHPVGSAIDMDDSMVWFDDDNDLDLSSKLQLDDYHEFMTKAAESDVKPSKRQPSFRRALSLNQLPFGANNSPVPPLPKTTHPTPLAPTPLRQPVHQHPQARQFLAPARGAQTSNSAIEASARYYQDPEARLKLRVYLASPQKFDEAIEFGFPSMEDTEDLPLSRPSLSRAHKTAPCKTFLHDDIPFLFDALDGDDDAESTTSLPERDAPYTPMESVFNHDTTLLSTSEATRYGSSSTLFPKSTVRHHTSEPFAQLLAGGREMTLRMTLTRPDLRADEKALYASTTGDDPLALEHLPPTKKEADIWDQRPKERGALKKFWRRVSGKGS